jgi:hypothetical protein
LQFRNFARFTFNRYGYRIVDRLHYDGAQILTALGSARPLSAVTRLKLGVTRWPVFADFIVTLAWSGFFFAA